MKELLLEDTFDSFLYIEGKVTTYADFLIDGTRKKDWYTRDELEELEDRNNLLWKEIRPVLFQMIKGNKTPLFFRIVLSPPVSLTGGDFAMNPDDRYFFNIKYENRKLTITTGISQKVFSMDRSSEREWDEAASVFLKKKGFAFES
ncbi:DUF5721 family protein [Anaerolentibacter hominis]|uniref:DUF5721 family protein n=1 Tax=Anaerolentibacter hominis TaxID=3079009 RepID=UPI0031B80DB5